MLYNERRLLSFKPLVDLLRTSDCCATLVDEQSRFIGSTLCCLVFMQSHPRRLHFKTGTGCCVAANSASQFDLCTPSFCIPSTRVRSAC